MTRDETVDEVVRRLVEHYRPERVYLFGSSARGDARPESDLDFLVVLPDETPRERFFDGKIYQRFGTFHLPWISFPSITGPSRSARAGLCLCLRSCSGKENWNMTPPLFPTQEAIEWLAAAARDIRLAELALDDSPPLAGEALYHAQQAAEKALKAFLIANKVAYPLTHDIRKLLRMCDDVDRQLAAVLLPAAGLTQFAARFRYPGEEQPTREEAIPWLDLARVVRDQVARRLAADCQ